MAEIAAFVLAGGRSSRMGADKALLELGGKSLIVRAIELAREVSPEVKIVGDPTKFGGQGEVIEDIFQDRGPLGGIHAALTASESEWNLILGVDLPFLTGRFLNFLVAQSKLSGATVTVPSTGGFFHPLCAVYRKEFAVLAERALAAGKNKIDALFPEALLHVISQEDLRTNGFDAAMFRNLNTPEEWSRARLEFDVRSL